jgi:hypothetical protein
MKIEVGEYYRTGQKLIVLCLAHNPYRKSTPYVLVTKNGEINEHREDGKYFSSGIESEFDIVEHLPDCTGFDWVPKPKLQLREGAWYKRKDGKIVGPCKRSTDKADRPWSIAAIYYKDDGTNTINWATIIEEVPDPTPKPVYRPFANRQEFSEHRDRWVKSSNADNNLLCRALAYNDTFVFFNEDPITMEEAFKKLLFEDGTPFGVKVS